MHKTPNKYQNNYLLEKYITSISVAEKSNTTVRPQRVATDLLQYNLWWTITY